MCALVCAIFWKIRVSGSGWTAVFVYVLSRGDRCIDHFQIWPMDLILASWSSVHEKESLKRYIVIICYLSWLLNYVTLLPHKPLLMANPVPFWKKATFTLFYEYCAKENIMPIPNYISISAIIRPKFQLRYLDCVCWKGPFQFSAERHDRIVIF